MNDAIMLLKQLGFGEYEAKAYSTLLQRSPRNGYELAKDSGIPRPNIYAVLERLEERGAVLRVETAAGVRFAPVPPGELTQRLSSRFASTVKAAEESLAQIAAPAEHEYVLNSHGYPLLVEQATALIDGARERLLMAHWPDEAEVLAEPLARADARGVEVTILCLRACATQCPHCRGSVHRLLVAPELRQRWLVLVADDAEVLAGQIGPGEEVQSVRTRQRLVVDLANWYVRHTIALAALVNEVGRRPDVPLAAETRAVLAAVARDASGGGWLEGMRQLIQ